MKSGNWWFSFVIVFPVFVHGQEFTVGSTYTTAQAESGQTLYTQHCAACHGSALEGGVAAPLVGQTFRVTWSRPNVNVDDLHFIISTTMPVLQGGTLTEVEYLAVLAFILKRNDVPAGPTLLSSDRKYLAAIQMASDDDVSSLSAPQFVEGEHGIVPKGMGPSGEDLLGAAENDTNWIHHTRTYQGTRYSPLSRINTENVENLRPQCIYQVGVPGPFQTGADRP